LTHLDLAVDSASVAAVMRLKTGLLTGRADCPLLSLILRISIITAIDRYRSSIVNTIRDPKLHEIVKCNMIHGPCGCFNRNSPCMKDNVCRKQYPKNLIKETQTGHDSYPKYKRRLIDDGGFFVNIKSEYIDNRWVVPYNPVLL